jgi:hypothetical protein
MRCLLLDAVSRSPIGAVALRRRPSSHNQAGEADTPQACTASKPLLVGDLRVRERSGSGMIVGRVLPTPLSDHGVLVPVAGDPCVPQVRGRCRAAGVAARGRGLASPRQPATPLVARSSGSLRVGPAAAATAADAPAGQTGHVAGLAPSPDSPPVAVPEPARPPIVEQADPRADLPTRTRESPVGISANTWRSPQPGLSAK